MSGPISTKSCSSHSSSDLSEAGDPFAPLLKRIEPKRFSEFAIFVRQGRSPGNEEKATCEIRLPPMRGAYNLVYRLDFSDGVSWAMRIPMPNKDGDYEGPQTRFMDSEVATIEHLRQSTTIPIPEIISWAPTDEQVGVPYILMEFVSGLPVGKLWFKSSGETPLKERRLRILDGIAACMSQLSTFSFRTIGSLCASHWHFASSPFNVVNEQADLDAMENKTEAKFAYTRIGPFTSSQSYLKSLLSMQNAPDLEEDPGCEIAFGAHRLLLMMIECLPLSAESGESRESFVLAHPDLDVQNVLAKENGTITAFIDWDNVHTVPRYIGYSRYPSWITRDWDPERYGFGDPLCRFESSPEELEYYRGHYAAAMRALRHQGQIDFTTKSHLHEAVWIAAMSPISKFRIVKKIFEYVFPPDQQDDEDSLKFARTLYDIADEALEPDAEQRIYESFRRVFSVGSNDIMMGINMI